MIDYNKLKIQAEDINKIVQDKIAPHLFFFCNYLPSDVEVNNPDARFYKGVLEAYKLLIDCSIINKLCKHLNSHKIKFNVKSIFATKRKIEMMRSALAHNSKFNNSELQKWLLINGVDDRTKIDYLRHPAVEVERLINESISEYSKLINSLAMIDKKDIIINCWEEAIIDFYCSGHSEIIRNEIKELYIAMENSRRDKVKSQDINNKMVAKWVKERLEDCFKSQIRNLSLVKGKLTSSTNQQLNKKINYYSNCLEGLKEKSEYEWVDWFVKEFNKYIREDINHEKKDNHDINFTLLPQGAIQDIISDKLNLRETFIL